MYEAAEMDERRRWLDREEILCLEQDGERGGAGRDGGEEVLELGTPGVANVHGKVSVVGGEGEGEEEKEGIVGHEEDLALLDDIVSPETRRVRGARRQLLDEIGRSFGGEDDADVWR